ncbi:MAG: glutamate racemase [Deltaproteobacteria bacterium]|nr:glutamate racemase [Deltaproteobacteria bacterium]
MQRTQAPIGVFDSGVGGLTVVRALRAQLPGEEVFYLGDTARVPYGSKSPETVARYSLACARFLLKYRVKLLMVACNTASAHALPVLRNAFEVPVLGAVEPGARAAAGVTQAGHVGVIGTLGTIRSRAYEEALKRLNPSISVTGQACPLLVPLAEEGWTDDEITLAVARRYLRELAAKDPAIDTLVLGCTHYPLLSSMLQVAARDAFGRSVTLVDSATAMAHAARDVLVSRGEIQVESLGERSMGGQLRCFVSDASRLGELASRFLGESVGDFEQVDL